MILAPIRLAARLARGAVDVLNTAAGRLACHQAGYHVPSWRRALELGIADRPVCAVCDTPILSDEDTATGGTQ